ncbi:hypothetical protein [Hymenobacter negativus]|uniref:Uncharacterized protein n=1 Tax=Hymenobacter negativus TaxID=2795026 RepID=A0ABS3QGQ1_9BACT|nr:hypothetical protein [Hymenobacter negativus]MBO2010163.1 hypothetical protein [Hymenobacter negativus]
MATPFESEEFSDAAYWRDASRKKRLNINNCISSWTDICGFGSLLEANDWDLARLQEQGVVYLLNQMHLIAGRPLMIGIDPYPNDKVIVLNDGIARTIDLLHIDRIDAHVFLLYVRDLLFSHLSLLRITKVHNVGVRTVVAGGQRVQYSAASTTGHSNLYYDENNVSDYGKKLLNTTFVYNPAEFQMNTAFAKAYTLDSLGSKSGIVVNGFYIESEFFAKIKPIKELKIDVAQNNIMFYRSDMLMFELNIKNTISLNIKGVDTVVYHIDKFVIHKMFDGDDLEFDLFNQVE